MHVCVDMCEHVHAHVHVYVRAAAMGHGSACRRGRVLGPEVRSCCVGVSYWLSGSGVVDLDGVGEVGSQGAGANYTRVPYHDSEVPVHSYPTVTPPQGHMHIPRTQCATIVARAG